MIAYEIQLRYVTHSNKAPWRYIQEHPSLVETVTVIIKLYHHKAVYTYRSDVTLLCAENSNYIFSNFDQALMGISIHFFVKWIT